jgi:hypothetical protein
MTPEQRAKISAAGAAYADKILPPLTDEQADTIAEILFKMGVRTTVSRTDLFPDCDGQPTRRQRSRSPRHH